MTDAYLLPKGGRREQVTPEKRKGFTPRQTAAVFIKYEARCAKCREKVSLGNYHIDHIQRIDAGGKHELENWQLLCIPCHKPKTKIDNFEAKKGRRIRGELKPRVKRAIPQPANYRWGSRKLEGRGFDKTKTRTLSGKVRERT